jgi:hypothetical protein
VTRGWTYKGGRYEREGAMWPWLLLGAVGVVLLVFGLTACGGGGGPHISKPWLQGEIKRQANLDLLGTGSRVSDVSCVQDGGTGYHFECLASLTNGNGISFRATCDTSSYCVWKAD